MSTGLHTLSQQSCIRLLNSLTTAVLVLDEHLTLQYMNLAAESLLAISARQFINAPLADIFQQASQDIEEIKAALNSTHSFTRRKTRIHLPSGNSIQADYTVTPLNEVPGAAVLMEIHSMSYAERITRDEMLISTHATTRELVRGLAHEIKNPLGGIRGAAQLLASELPESELREYTNVIIEEADRLRNLVDRLIGSRQPMDLRAVNIHEVLERVRNLLHAEVRHQDIDIVRDYDPSIPRLTGDFEQLIQALLNIVKNAVQALDNPHNREHGGRIILRTRVMHHATIGTLFHRLVARIEVIDNGPGVAPGLINNIFYPMISGRADGTGLGLSIAHSIVHQHRGIIECHSEQGCTRFTIYLPVEPDPSVSADDPSFKPEAPA